jgi:lysophospholipase L1-like esterase
MGILIGIAGPVLFASAARLHKVAGRFFLDIHEAATLKILIALLIFAASGVSAQNSEVGAEKAIENSGAAAQKAIDRYESEILALEAQPFPEPNGIVVTGSSTIRKWGTIKADLAPLPIIPRGFGGSTTEELKHYLARIVFPYAPRAVVIYSGDNDLAEGRTVEQILATTNEITGLIRAQLPDAKVYVIGIKPSISRWNLWPTAVRANQLLQALCEKDSQLTYIDAGKGLLGSDGKPKSKYYAEDLLHFSPEGYKVWTAAIKPVLIADDRKTPKAPARLKVAAMPTSLRFQ